MPSYLKLQHTHYPFYLFLIFSNLITSWTLHPISLFNFTMPSRLSDAFKSHPVHLHHKHLDFDSVQELPDSYAWTQLDEYPSSGDSLIGSESVPIIDLTDPNALQLIGHACKTWGVFQVTHHGISNKLLDDMEILGRSLFSLPVQEKLKVARSPEGVSGYGLARISSFFSKLMWSEGFTVVGSPQDHFRQLWPQDYSKFWYSCTCRFWSLLFVFFLVVIKSTKPLHFSFIIKKI